VNAFATLRARFFQRVLAYEPEEATTLGVREANGRWKDWSPEALADEVAFYEGGLRELEASAPASPDEIIDRDVMARFARWKIHAWRDIELHLGHVEASLLPNAVIQFQRAHGWDVAQRLAAVPALVGQLEGNWRAALARGVVPDASVLSEAALRYLPEIAAGAARHDPQAGLAWAAHGEFLRAEVLPHAGESYAIGGQAYRWRLCNVLGIDDTPADLIERARSELEQVQSRLLHRARAMSSNALPDLAAAAAFVAEVGGERLDDPLSGYAAILDCATGFVAMEGLLHLPDDLALELVPAQPGFPLVANWPAPLLDRQARGHFVVQADGRPHPRAPAAGLAVHEGIPGHYLQSAIWRHVFKDDPAPVRFLHLADFVAAAHQYWAPMLNVEGWAVYAEELMRRACFFADDEEELCVWASHAVRWARVVVDISLHTGRMDTDTAERFLVEQACVSPEAAKGEVERHKRLPLRAITHALGWKRIEALAAASELPPADFHAAFLAAGPVFSRF